MASAKKAVKPGKKPAPRKPAPKKTLPARKPAAKKPAAQRKPAPKKPVAAPAPVANAERPALLASKCTAVAFVDAIEPVLPFWGKVGFFPAVTVPNGDKAGFVILSNGSVELMYQTWSLLGQDMPALAARAIQPDKVFLFVEVADIDAVALALAEHEVFMARRETFYGATEIGYRDPQGHFVTFAQFKR